MVCCSLKIPLPSYAAAQRTLCIIRKNTPWSSLQVKPKGTEPSICGRGELLSRGISAKQEKGHKVQQSSAFRTPSPCAPAQVREQRGSSSSEREPGSRSRQHPTTSQQYGLATVRRALLQAKHSQEVPITISLCPAPEATCGRVPRFWPPSTRVFKLGGHVTCKRLRELG